ncbi:hypothetical protein [Bosea vaviloviae]|uniref:Uncharacterized protein n=1 Tax=Bosea vaviloviae TaxID=1526658 RepID=A0A1D7U813_9HYPH|nr:hypothetical protein [Bosea vaviloviae]AOO83531.1 hypothetical protein BHK69_26570 [Bosea vaviloviae]
MSEPDESPSTDESIEHDLGEITESMYLQLLNSSVCEWLSAADADAYDGLLDLADFARPRAVVPGLTLNPS